MHRHRDPIQRGLAEKKSGSAACQGVCDFSRRNETLFAALSAVCRDRLRGCVNLAGARKRIFEVCVTLNINWHHQGAALDGLLVPPKTVGLWFSHPRKVQILFALCPAWSLPRVGPRRPHCPPWDQKLTPPAPVDS